MARICRGPPMVLLSMERINIPRDNSSCSIVRAKKEKRFRSIVDEAPFANIALRSSGIRRYATTGDDRRN